MDKAGSGLLVAGGLIKTLGQRITWRKPVGGFCAKTDGAATWFVFSALGILVSTAHTITGSILGVG